jgi:hypothetical protein
MIRIMINPCMVVLSSERIEVQQTPDCTTGKEPREIKAPFVIFCFFCVFQRTSFSAQRFIVSGQPFLYGLSEKGTEEGIV